MTRAKAGWILIGLGAALAFATYLAWSFGTQSEAKAQYAENIYAEAAHEPPRDIDPNRAPAALVGVAAMSALAGGLVLRPPRRTPVRELPSSFFGGRPPAP